MWEAVQANARRSWTLIFALGALLLALGASIGGAWAGGQEGILLGLMVTGVVWLVMTLVAVTQGGNILLAFSGAREVTHDDAPQLHNIVEEMRIAASLPATPKVYIIENAAPNAFAVGTPGHAAVAVTTGLLSTLNRDELQGVIAHEIGHIHNQDTRFMTIAGVMLGTIVILADVFVRSMFYGGGRRRSSRSSDRGGGQLQIILFVLAILLAILAPILANLLYLACSRSREYLADASAALFTRYPEGLASALAKIAGSAARMENVNRAVAPMFIVNPLAAKGSAGSLFSTHPPTEERIRILRAMGGAGLQDYDQAYRAASGGRGLIGQATLRSQGELAMRGIRPAAPDTAADRRHRTREANDILLRANSFRFIDCACGMRFKLPPNFAARQVQCPRCGARHDASTAQAAS